MGFNSAFKGLITDLAILAT